MTAVEMSSAAETSLGLVTISVGARTTTYPQRPASTPLKIRGPLRAANAAKAAPTANPMAAPYRRPNASFKVAAVGPTSEPVSTHDLKTRAAPNASAPERRPPVARTGASNPGLLMPFDPHNLETRFVTVTRSV